METGGALEHLVHNISLNADTCSNVEAAACDWTLFEEQYGHQQSSSGVGAAETAGVGAGEESATPKSETSAGTLAVKVEPPAGGSGGGGGDAGGDVGEDSNSAAAADDDTATVSLPATTVGTPGLLTDMQWDFIIGSDLIYSDEGVEMLPKVIAGLANENTTVLYCHTLYRYEMMDYDFIDGCKACGLEVEEVVAAGEPPPPPPVNRFETLFNDMRIAVFRMRKKPTAA
jgi:hypothetical protein